MQYFHYLCEKLGPYLKKEDTQCRVIVSVQETVTMSLHKLENGDGLQNIKDLNGVHKSTLSKIVKDFVGLLESICSQFLYKLQINHY